MDSGGADIHILMGLLKPAHTLTDFIENRVNDLNQIAQRMDGFKRVKIIAGTGESLQTANMPASTRAKILRHIDTPWNRVRLTRSFGTSEANHVS